MTAHAPSGRLGPAERDAALADMESQVFDVVVVGGGVVGAGAALDAATRGLSVALLEARDWASGTSSRSSKLIHGGLRYLEMLDFALVMEALRERGLILTRLAPHLCRPVSFLYPLRHRGWERPYVAAGVTMYDLLARTAGHGAGLPFHRHLSRTGALRAVPSMRKDALVGAVQYYDAQLDDARHTMNIVRTAAAYGARVANRARVVGFLREGERVVGVRVRDLEHGREIEVQAQQVINATGVWTDETQAMVGERGQFKVRASKGIHLVVPRDRILSTTGIILRTEKSVLFVIPWGRHWIVGTTDTEWSLDKAHPAASSSDIDYLLHHVNAVLATPLTREDVEGVYAGLRPLLAGESDETSRAVARACRRAPGAGPRRGGRRQVHDLPGDGQGRRRRGRPGAGLPGRRVVHRRGAPAGRGGVPGGVERQGPHRGAQPAARGAGGAPAAAVRVDGGRGAGAVLGGPRAGTAAARCRRLPRARRWSTPPPTRAPATSTTCWPAATRISIETWDRGVSTAPAAARLMAGVLGWSADQEEREVRHYLAQGRGRARVPAAAGRPHGGRRAPGGPGDRPARLNRGAPTQARGRRLKDRRRDAEGVATPTKSGAEINDHHQGELPELR